MHAFLFLIIALLFAPQTNAAPSRDCVTIDTGETYCAPFRAEKARELWILGTAKIDSVAALLRPWGLEPVLTREGDAIVNICLVQYEKSTPGYVRLS